jgi:NTE family protein
MDGMSIAFRHRTTHLIELVVALGIFASLFASSIGAQERSQSPRPRVGLVLGGGGAKGGAHVGVLKALEEMRIPVDCVVGTSVGSLVGGFYASGNDAAEVEMRVRAIDWSETLAFTGLREQLPMRRKQSGITYSNSLEFGVTSKGISQAAGIINTQHVEQTIRDIVRTADANEDFDKLPIPFRAVATDMRSGTMVVLAKGDLAQAMRASMAVQGAFSPVVMDGYVLSDGGAVRNLPVDVAKSACADVVIAVWLSTPAPEQDSLLSPLSLISRTLDVVIDGNVKAQLESLTPNDVPIEVKMGDLGAASFERLAEAIPLGYDAAVAHRTELQRFAVSPAEYNAWRARTARKRAGVATLADIRIVGLQRVNEAYVKSILTVRPGMQVDEKILKEQVTAVFSLGDFENVNYRLEGAASDTTLYINAVEKSWGPRFLRVDLGLMASSQGETPFVLRADYLHNWMNRAGGEIHGAAQIGRTSLVDFSFYQPFDAAHRWFVEPGVHMRSSIEDVYADGDTIARFDLQHANARADFGRTFGRLAELRVGIRGGKARAEPDIAASGIQGTDRENQIGWTANLLFDTRNTPLLPTSGWLARVDYFSSERAFNSEQNYRRLDSMLQMTHRSQRSGNVILLSVAAGTDLDSDLPLYEAFTMGGPKSFPGFGIGELRGTEYWIGSTSYLSKIGDISKLFGQSLYVGAQLQAGEMTEIPALSARGTYDDLLYSGSIFLSARTPIGPATLSVAGTSIGTWIVSFSLGRPIEEGSILDFAR